MTSFEHRKEQAFKNITGYKEKDVVTFHCTECNQEVKKELVNPEWILEKSGVQDFYVRKFSMCQPCIDTWIKEALTHLPLVMKGLAEAFEEKP